MADSRNILLFVDDCECMGGGRKGAGHKEDDDGAGSVADTGESSHSPGWHAAERHNELPLLTT